MGKSLTETAKAILMKEGMIPSVSPMDAGDPDRGAKSMTPNMATLRPNSRGAEGRLVNPGSMPPVGDADDLGGQTPESGAPTDNLGARAAGKTKKDSSRSGVSAVPQEPMKKTSMAEEMEDDEEDKKKKLQELYRQIKEAKKAEKEEDDEDDEDEEEMKEEALDEVRRYGTKRQETTERIRANKLDAASMNATEDPKGYGRAMNAFDKAKTTLKKAKERKSSYDNWIEEDFELSEELEAFIDAMLEEGYSEEQIAEAIEENFEIVSEEEQLNEVGDTEKGQKKLGMVHQRAERRLAATARKSKFKPSEEDKEDNRKNSETMQLAHDRLKEHVDALLDGEQLSEEFRVKAETIFESAVNTRLQEELSVIEEAYAESLQEEVSAIMDQLTEQVDDYLNYVVEQWIAENEVAIESGLRSELTEDFISGLRNLFAEHYIDVPEEKVSIVEGLAEKVDALEGKLNEEIERNVSLNKMLAESKKYEILRGACGGLTDTQADKLFALAENIDFNSTDEYARKIHTLKESYFPSTVTAQTSLDNVEDADGRSMISEELQGPMNAYVRALGKSLPK